MKIDAGAHGGKVGYFYIPWPSHDDAGFIVASVIQRQSRGKPPRQIIVSTEAEKKSLENSIYDYLRERRQEYDAAKAANLSDVPALERNVRAYAKTVGFLKPKNGPDAAIQVDETTHILSKLDPAQSKLYVTGHGDAGIPGIGRYRSENAPFEILSMENMAAGLDKAGLSKNYQDLRFLLCHSADATRPASFDAQEKYRSSRVEIDAQNKTVKAPPAWYAQQALQRYGFKSVVTGYHGLIGGQDLPNNPWGAGLHAETQIAINKPGLRRSDHRKSYG